jgi:class 3 adenylate cyclase
MDGSTSFGEWLKRRRTALHLSREQLAQRVGCAAVTLRKIESDERRPSVQLAERLALVLDVPSAAQPSFVSVARAGLPLNSLSPPATMRVSPMLPRGTVTFLLADIADDPQLWMQHPQAMHDLRSHYAAILQRAITGAGGDIVKINGDVVGAAFANPLDAITAALATHRALGAESWGAIGPLPVRMVVHTGVVAEPTDAFVGEPTNWAMQLLAASHGFPSWAASAWLASTMCWAGTHCS